MSPVLFHVESPAFGKVTISANNFITAAVTVKAPSEAKPGDRFQFSIIQRDSKDVLGGSTYLLVVTDEQPTRK